MPLKRCAGSSVVRMTIPGGTRTPYKAQPQLAQCLAHRLLSRGRSSQATGVRPFVPNRNICNFLWYGGVERGLRAKVLGRLGWRLQAPSKSVCSILPLARHLRAGASYGVPALSFGLEVLKRVGHAPSTFGSRPSGGHISNVGGCLSTLLARVRSQAPLCAGITHLR